MTDQSQSIETDTNADADEAAPTWQEMREHGCMLIDDEHQKLAVYAGDLGACVLVSQEFESGIHFIPLHVDLINQLIQALQKVRGEATQIAAEWDAKYEAIEKMDPYCTQESTDLAAGGSDIK